jgi:anthranilate phosphoribosyltransferase
VSGKDGLGEVTLAGTTEGTEVTSAAEREFAWEPEDFGIPRAPLEAINISGPEDSVELVRGVLAGELGPARDIVLLNAAAGLLVVGHADKPREAAAVAAHSLDNGAAADLLEKLVRLSHEPAASA